MSEERRNFVALVVLTAGAVLLMVTIGAGTGGFGLVDDGDLPGRRADDGRALPKSRVVVLDAQPGPVEITDVFAGMVQPFERYTLGFEIGGQIAEIGQNAQGEPLDVGDLVEKGALVARLDQRLLQAQLKDSKARLEQAQADMRRADELRERNDRTITEQAYQDWVTKLRLAEAAVEMAETRLDDAQLVAPVTGRVSLRKVNVGETVNPQQAIFEIVEVDKVLLVLGVPETRISDVKLGQKVHVEILGRDRFGQPFAGYEGTIYEVSPTADTRTGYFPVEVLVPNVDERLSPGKVARGRVVVDTIDGFALPSTSAVLRDGKTMLFYVDQNDQAQPWELTRWVEQGPEVVVPADALPESCRRVVVRGQHRLTAGRDVEVASVEAAGSGPAEQLGNAPDQSPVVRVQP